MENQKYIYVTYITKQSGRNKISVPIPAKESDEKAEKTIISTDPKTNTESFISSCKNGIYKILKDGNFRYESSPD